MSAYIDGIKVGAIQDYYAYLPSILAVVAMVIIIIVLVKTLREAI